MMKINEIDMCFWSNNDENLNDLPSEINYSEVKSKQYEKSVSFTHDDDIISTMWSCSFDTSVGNVSLDRLEIYQIETDELEINYRGPKILPKKWNSCNYLHFK